MIRLPRSLAAWGSPDFAATLKAELEAVDPGLLPLQQGLTASSYAVGEGFQAAVLGAAEDADHIVAKVGLFYAGIIAGCNCAGDPSAVEPQSEYCEIALAIDRRTAAAVAVLSED